MIRSCIVLFASDLVTIEKYHSGLEDETPFVFKFETFLFLNKEMLILYSYI